MSAGIRSFCITVPVLFGLCEGCLSPNRDVSIGTYSPQVVEASEISSVLVPAGITWAPEGSIVYAIYVPAKDAARAKILLEKAGLASRIQLLDKPMESP